MSRIELNTSKQGRISGGIQREITSIIIDCFHRFGSVSPYSVDVLLLDSTEGMRLFLKEKNLRMGVIDDGKEETIEPIACSYDIINENPRIIICIEQYKKFSKTARAGMIRRQCGHIILHGSLEFRIFRIPEECLHTAAIKGLDLSVLDTALHHLSAAVMDIEITRFLIKHNYNDCQAQFALEFIQPAEKDRERWRSVKIHRPAKFIFLISLLGPILMVQPILSMPRTKKLSVERQVMLNSRMENLIEYLENYEQNKLVEVANTIADNLTEDTHANVDAALIHALSLA